jgi:hypothetical protein
MTAPLFIEMQVHQHWDNVERVRRVIHQAVLATYGSMDLADTMSMVASELLENAFRYGEGGGARLRMAHEDQALTIAISNALGPRVADRVVDLARRIHQLNAFRDPAEAFRVALEQRPRDSDVNGLGLARVIYEGDCRLDCDLSQPGEVTVRASRPLTTFAT